MSTDNLSSNGDAKTTSTDKLEERKTEPEKGKKRKKKQPWFPQKRGRICSVKLKAGYMNLQK